MATAILCTVERKGAGLTRTNLASVKNAKLLKMNDGNQVTEHPLQGLLPTKYLPSNGSKISGKADLLLSVGGKEIDLARCKWAVALVINANGSTTLYWIDEGQCSGIDHPPNTGVAFANVESRHCPECQLPPRLPDK